MANLDERDVSRRWKAYPDTKQQLLRALELGWHLRTSGGGKPRLFCPCDQPDPRLQGGRRASVTVNWTPQNDGSHAGRIKGALAKRCPEDHQIMR